MADSSPSYTARFSGGDNSGIHLGQNFGSIHVHQSAAGLVVENECHQLFWLPNSEGVGYDWYKNRIAERVKGTCEWFLKHPNYRTWKESISGLLLVTADPGCGKSVLAKHLIDHELAGPVCYFFFKDKDQDTLKKALCALLHQIMRHRPSTIKHALPDYQAVGPTLVDSIDVLWKIWVQILQDTETSPMTIVLDALDECMPVESRELIARLVPFFDSKARQVSVKFLCTTRPYENTLSHFGFLASRFPEIRIPGEELSNQIREEVNLVIKHRTASLAKNWGLRLDLAEHIEKTLLEVTHRTYLWVYLVFESMIEKLNDNEFKKTKTQIDNFINKLPQSVNDVYAKILSRPKNQARLRKVLSIILAAARPLHVDELNIAVGIAPIVSKSFKSLDLESKEDFQVQLRNWCGLFISIDDDRVYLLHQTAREFLLSPACDIRRASGTEEQRWQGSLALHECHDLLTNICLTFICFPQFDKEPIHKIYPRHNRLHEEVEAIFPARSRSFFNYAASFWPIHASFGGPSLSADIVRLALHACSLYEHMPRIWFRVYKGRGSAQTSASLDYYSQLMVATATRLASLVRLFLEPENVNYQTAAGTSALSVAANGLDRPVVELLLAHGARATLEMVDTGRLFRPGSQPDGYAIVQLLVRNRVDLNSLDRYGKGLLHSSIRANSQSACQFLLDKGANVDHLAKDGTTPLHAAADVGDVEILRLLLDHNPIVDFSNQQGETPLARAVLLGHSSAVQILLNKGASVHTKDNYGRHQILSQAVENNQVETVQLLLAHGADVNSGDRFDDTKPLAIALRNDNQEIIQLLLKYGGDINEL